MNTVQVVSYENEKRVVVKNCKDSQVKEVCKDFHAEFIGVNDGSISVKLSREEQATVKASLMTAMKTLQEVKESLVRYRRWATWSDEQVHEYNYATEEIVKINSIINKLQ